MKRSYCGKVYQMRYRVKVWLWTPYMVANCSRCVMALWDGGQISRCVSREVRNWYAYKVCQMNNGTLRFVPDDVWKTDTMIWRLGLTPTRLPDNLVARRNGDFAAKKYMETWFYRYTVNFRFGNMDIR